MRAPIALAATCVTVSAVLLLTACGGDSKNDGDKITDVSTGKAPSSAPAPTTTSASPSASGVARPTITLPADVKDVFEGGTTGDAVKDAILADNQGFVMAVDDGFVKGSGTTDALVFYSTGKGLTNSISYINDAAKQGFTRTGTIRYFDRKVAILPNGHASVIYCSDESQAFLKHRSSGKVDRNAPSAQSYVLYNTNLVKNAQGVWQTNNITSQRGAKQCQP
ncbi:hypothetical protein [Streptomyces sp. NPDC049040]|uniref:hypothetical protein n=1 Tax=Streptomyces sp. NPDC049040 TaxID=3365593 RepID=UPI003723DF9A